GNALKHARASEIVIGLSSPEEGVVRMEIADNGRGLPSSKRSGAGIGLQVMKHRANAIGAELTVKSQRGEGVTVTCILTRKHEASDYTFSGAPGLRAVPGRRGAGQRPQAHFVGGRPSVHASRSGAVDRQA